MTNPTLSNTVSVLESFFSKLNDKLFGGELPKPVITVSPDTKRQCYGWCTTWKAWRDSHDNDIRNGFFEINICAEYLGRPIDCKFRSNGTSVPLRRNGYSILTGTKYRFV